MDTTYQLGQTFIAENIGSNHYIVYPNPAIHAGSLIAMTGSNVVKYIEIPFLHRINKFHANHLDNAYAKSETTLSVKIELELTRSRISRYLSDVLFYDNNVRVSEMDETFGDSFEYEGRVWTITMNTTNTHYLLPLFYIQRLDGAKQK